MMDEADAKPESESESHDNFLGVLSATVTVCTILQFMAGIRECYKFRQNRSTGDSSALPFVVGTLNCAIWWHYGVLVAQTSMQVVNAVGFFLMVTYSYVFYIYAPKQTQVLKQIVFTFGIFTTVEVVVLGLVGTFSTQKSVLGAMGALLSVLFCASPLASMAAVVRTRSTESMPLPLIVMTFVVCLQWWIFGTMIGDVFVGYPNALGCVLAGTQIGLFLYYNSKAQANGSLSKSSSASSFLA